MISAIRTQWLDKVIVVLMFAAFARSQASAQVNVQRTRDMWDSTFLTKRPAGHKPMAPRPVLADDALLGITVWRLRASLSSDQPAIRELIHEQDETQSFTPERISSATPLHDGEKIRISIEVARTGYLYVIDRDQYTDGSKSDPYLIFPELRIDGGDNRVYAGKVVEIPSMGDNPPFFRMRRSRADQTAELLSIIVSPKKIEGFTAGRDRLKLDALQVEDWETKWKSQTYPLEAVMLAGKTPTSAEKAAESSGNLLTQDDPLPQTMYHCDTKPGKPLLVELPLEISK